MTVSRVVLLAVPALLGVSAAPVGSSEAQSRINLPDLPDWGDIDWGDWLEDLLGSDDDDTTDDDDQTPEPPVWPGGKQCSGRKGLLYDAYSTAPAGLPEGSLRKGTPENSCTQVCLPKGVSGAASKHGVLFGSTCFGTNDGTANPEDKDGVPIPPNTAVCPGAEFVLEGKTAGVTYFTYACTGGPVLDYGAPYK